MADWLDLFQFVNKASTGAGYASCTLLNLVMQHLELVKSVRDYVSISLCSYELQKFWNHPLIVTAGCSKKSLCIYIHNLAVCVLCLNPISFFFFFPNAYITLIHQLQSDCMTQF